jgi:uncharacterized protein YndB with AHSA1/START domain
MMKNITKMKIDKPASEVFEAFVHPEKIGNYWFSSSSERWEQGKTITLKYNEYNAEGQMEVIELEMNKKIVFKWGPPEEVHTVTISLNEVDDKSTIVEIVEDGFIEKDDNLLLKMLDNKEGWVYMLTCLKGYLENGINNLRADLVK